MSSAEDLLGSSLAVLWGPRKWKLTWPCSLVLADSLPLLCLVRVGSGGQSGRAESGQDRVVCETWWALVC